MAHLKTQHLLFRLASSFYTEKEAFSKQEILQKINEIKFLSEQKKVPRFQLQKEIIHLEHKLNVVFALEQQLAHQRRHESSRVAALKREISNLRTKLALTQDPEFSARVEKMAHAMGTIMAQRETKSMVDVATQDITRLQKLTELESKLERLESLVEIQRRLEPGKAAILDARIREIKAKLGHPVDTSVVEVAAESQDNISRHKILFTLPAVEQQKFESADMESEKELPLPPPPKGKR